MKAIEKWERKEVNGWNVFVNIFVESPVEENKKLIFLYRRVLIENGLGDVFERLKENLKEGKIQEIEKEVEKKIGVYYGTNRKNFWLTMFPFLDDGEKVYLNLSAVNYLLALCLYEIKSPVVMEREIDKDFQNKIFAFSVYNNTYLFKKPKLGTIKEPTSRSFVKTIMLSYLDYLKEREDLDSGEMLKIRKKVLDLYQDLKDLDILMSFREVLDKHRYYDIKLEELLAKEG